MILSLLTSYHSNELIFNWKKFLKLKKIYSGELNSNYDFNFYIAIQHYQYCNNLVVDGIIGNYTLLSGLKEGLKIPSKILKHFPFSPKSLLPCNEFETFLKFGFIEFKHQPLLENNEHIIITNNFEKDNIIKVHIPQITKITFGKRKFIKIHKIAYEPLKLFFDQIEKRKLLSMIKTFNGSYVPRLIRGSKTQLSSHAFGIAFDINMQWNMLSTEPALLGHEGSVRELVPIAHDHGFYWGGHFSRKDGMHFELAKTLL